MKDNYKLALGCALLLACEGSCLADTKIGIGTGLTTGFSIGYSGVISIPIKMGTRTLIEPYMSYSKYAEDVDPSLPDYDYGDAKSIQVGIGLYGLRKLGAEYELYYGAAVALAKSDRTSEYANGEADNGDVVPYYLSRNDIEATEYMIKPTLGFSYLINKNFTVSVDAGIYYSWGEENNRELKRYFSPSLADRNTDIEYKKDIERINTFSRLIFRMMF